MKMFLIDPYNCHANIVNLNHKNLNELYSLLNCDNIDIIDLQIVETEVDK